VDIPGQTPRSNSPSSEHRAPGSTLTAQSERQSERQPERRPEGAPLRSAGIPTQRGEQQLAPERGRVSGPTASLTRPLTEPIEAPTAPEIAVDAHRHGMVVVAIAAILGLAGVGTTVAYVQRADAAEAVRVAHSAELDVQAQAFTAEQSALRVANSAAVWAHILATRAAAVVAGKAILVAASAALADAPQAGDAPRTALQSAIDAASAIVVAVPTPSVRVIDAALGAVVGPQQAATAAQAAWQVTEDARLAAQASADAAAAQAAAQAQAAQSSRSTHAARSTTPAPAVPAPTTSVPEFSAGALGGAINSWRNSQGLPSLSVSRSASLVAQSGAMAEAGDIWDGPAKIVGYAQPASAAALVQAWANSPDHRAWMVRTNVSSMQVGAVVLNNRLYGAVNFS